jgi:hypothetical protein
MEMVKKEKVKVVILFEKTPSGRIILFSAAFCPARLSVRGSSY